MIRLTAASLAQVLEATFPLNASCWSKATNEVRDMCRGARILAGLSEGQAVDFREINSPAEWNRQGIAGTVRFYELLDEDKQQQFCERFEEWLVEWQRKAGLAQPS